VMTAPLLISHSVYQTRRTQKTTTRATMYGFDRTRVGHCASCPSSPTCTCSRLQLKTTRTASLTRRSLLVCLSLGGTVHRAWTRRATAKIFAKSLPHRNARQARPTNSKLKRKVVVAILSTLYWWTIDSTTVSIRNICFTFLRIIPRIRLTWS
jgi:hypothetical protein